jgi:7,8-dihydroneopterin aldolase/epimerase/oxygenase
MNHLRTNVADVATTPNSRSTCRVILDGIEVMATIGTRRDEREVAQPLRLSVLLDIIPPDVDALESTFDYSIIREFAQELATVEIVLIETFALRLAQKCLAHRNVLSAEVRIEKPKAVPGCIAGTLVSVTKA